MASGATAVDAQPAGRLQPLPRSIPRCRGYGTGEGRPDADCLGCARRVDGISDYMDGRPAQWMVPPADRPCRDRLQPRQLLGVLPVAAASGADLARSPAVATQPADAQGHGE